MKDILKSSLLYDFYGELLTEHQKEIYEDFILNDLSLGEIAQERGISRQGVHDLVKRCDKTLNGYEEKLHLVERFSKTKEDVLKICQLADGQCKEEDVSKIKQIAQEILDNY
ncbi:MAG: YlxM family DNA-binding protein [Eubacterium sp.]